jgi:hypothetical protein
MLECILQLGEDVMANKTVLSVLLGLLAHQGYCASSVAYQRVAAAGTVAHVVTVNLADPDVRVSVALARGGAGRAEGFKSLISRTKPAAAITGTFFDTRTLIPTGDIALFGTLVHSGCIGSALCIDCNNKATIVPLRKGRQCKWNGYETVLCAGPTLISQGKVAIALKHEGFRRVAMHGKRRTAAGITQSGKLVMVCVNRGASLYQVAKLMLTLNVTHAVCLDGGSSTAFYHNGSYLAVPGRTLTNCLVVYKSESDYREAKNQLAPARLLAKADARPRTSPLSELSPALLLPPGDLYPAISATRP